MKSVPKEGNFTVDSSVLLHLVSEKNEVFCIVGDEKHILMYVNWWIINLYVKMVDVLGSFFSPSLLKLFVHFFLNKSYSLSFSHGCRILAPKNFDLV